MKQGFALYQSQQLSLTPALQHAIQLLQLSGLELDAAIAEQAQENPFLVYTPKDGLLSTPSSIAANGSIVININNINNNNYINNNNNINNNKFDGFDADDYLDWVANPPATLRQHLQEQVRLLPTKRCSPVMAGILTLLIDSLEPTGYFASDLSTLTADLAKHCGVAVDVEWCNYLQQAITLLQTLDPAGIGVFSLQECLKVQLLHASPTEAILETKTSVHRLAVGIVEHGFDALLAKNRVRLKKCLLQEAKKNNPISIPVSIPVIAINTITNEQISAALQLIQQLHAKPGLLIDAEPIEYAVPEIIVIKSMNQWQALLNQAVVPAIVVDQTHAKLLKTPEFFSSNHLNKKDKEKDKDKDNKEFKEAQQALQTQWHTAKQWVRTVQQHFETLLRVAQAIVAMQQDYFEFGAKKIKPMVLRDVAQILGLHESTISRITTKKYMQTPHGVLEFKYFFSSSVSGNLNNLNNLNNLTSTLTPTSSTAIKSFLHTLLKGENDNQPLTDQVLTEQLAQAGYVVARRTVAKYREQLGYAPAHARKTI